MKAKLFRAIVLVSLVFTQGYQARAQKVGVKTNLLYWATTSPNLGVEIAMTKKWTFDFAVGASLWAFEGNKKFKHWAVFPELRYWTCEAFNGHFFGIHGLAGQYNVGNLNLPIGALKKLSGFRYEGWASGAGLTYGYQFVLSRRWNVEASISAGYVFFDYRKFNCVKCGKMIEDGTQNYLGPTKASISLVYML